MEAAQRRAIAVHVDAFCSAIHSLTRGLARRFPDDPLMYRAERRILAAIAVNPIAVIDTAGPYLYSFREQIYSKDRSAQEKFFLARSYDSELARGGPSDTTDLAAHIIPRVQELAPQLSEAERASYWRTVVGLLDDYVEYQCALHGVH